MNDHRLQVLGAVVHAMRFNGNGIMELHCMIEHCIVIRRLAALAYAISMLMIMASKDNHSCSHFSQLNHSNVSACY